MVTSFFVQVSGKLLSNQLAVYMLVCEGGGVMQQQPFPKVKSERFQNPIVCPIEIIII